MSSGRPYMDHTIPTEPRSPKGDGKMRPEIREALEAARGPIEDNKLVREVVTRRRYSFNHVWMTVLSVLRNVPEGTTLDELRDELELSNNQAEEM